jgi:hypothetical protein
MKFLMNKAATSPPAPMASPVPPGASAPAVTAPGVPDEIFMLLTVIYIIAGLGIGLIAAGNIMAGFWLKKQVRRGLTYAVAALNCACFPFGTVLGVFTFIVLNRPTVAMTYDANSRA